MERCCLKRRYQDPTIRKFERWLRRTSSNYWSCIERPSFLAPWHPYSSASCHNFCITFCVYIVSGKPPVWLHLPRYQDLPAWPPLCKEPILVIILHPSIPTLEACSSITMTTKNLCRAIAGLQVPEVDQNRSPGLCYCSSGDRDFSHLHPTNFGPSTSLPDTFNMSTQRRLRTIAYQGEEQPKWLT